MGFDQYLYNHVRYFQFDGHNYLSKMVTYRKGYSTDIFDGFQLSFLSFMLVGLSLSQFSVIKQKGGTQFAM